MRSNELSGCQARAARAMLMWSVRRLAQASGISDSSIRRIESGFGTPANVTLDLLVRLRRFYESKGFVFTWNNDAPGIEWRKSDRRRTATDRRGPGSVETSAEDWPPSLRM